MPESQAYRIVKAPHDAVVPVDLWELAFALRPEKAASQPNNPGTVRNKVRSYS